MVSKKVKIIYDKYKVFYVTTNNYGRGYLKINTKALHSVKLIYEGSGYYKASSKSFTLNCYVEKTKIVVPSLRESLLSMLDWFVDIAEKDNHKNMT